MTTTTSPPSLALLAPTIPVSLLDSGTLWNDLDLNGSNNKSTSHISCGGKKCFYPSLSDPTKGYLIADAAHLTRMQQGVDWAYTLQQEFGFANVKHLFDGYPTLVAVNHSMVQQLVRLVDRPVSQVFAGDEDNNTDAAASVTSAFQHISFLEFHGNSNTWQVAVQRVHVLPQPYLWIGLGYHNYIVMMENAAPRFRQEIQEKYNRSSNNNSNSHPGTIASTFGRQLRREIYLVSQILQRYPALYFDFQGIIDTAGNFYHADLDGHVDKGHWRNTTQVQAQIEIQTRRFWYLHGYLLHPG